MSCLILCAVFIQGSVEYEYPKAQAPVGEYHLHDRNVYDNPAGELAVGLEWEVGKKWTIGVDLWKHRSLIGSSTDRGLDSSGLFVTFKPFRR
jgi:hypothetical protein